MKTIHNLEFEIADWIMPDFKRFRIGTCEGLWRSTQDSYDILAIDNKNPGNGHLEDVFQLFENSCKRDKKSFMILEVWNNRFLNHLLMMRGFEKLQNTLHVIKHY